MNLPAIKDKVAPPFKTCDIDLIYGKGVSKEAELLDLGVKYDIVEKSGSWFSYEGEKLGQGRENVKEYLRNNPNLCEEIHTKIRNKYFNID